MRNYKKIQKMQNPGVSIFYEASVLGRDIWQTPRQPYLELAVRSIEAGAAEQNAAGLLERAAGGDEARAEQVEGAHAHAEVRRARRVRRAPAQRVPTGYTRPLNELVSVTTRRIFKFCN